MLNNSEWFNCWRITGDTAKLGCEPASLGTPECVIDIHFGVCVWPSFHSRVNTIKGRCGVHGGTSPTLRRMWMWTGDVCVTESQQCLQCGQLSLPGPLCCSSSSLRTSAVPCSLYMVSGGCFGFVPAWMPQNSSSGMAHSLLITLKVRGHLSRCNGRY